MKTIKVKDYYGNYLSIPVDDQFYDEWKDKHGCRIIGEQHPDAKRKDVPHCGFLCRAVNSDQRPQQNPNRHLRKDFSQIRIIHIE